jgi:hypothetical protein
MVASTVFIPFIQKKGMNIIIVLATGAFGGAFPDIDAISLWSGFDDTFGQLLNLSNNGRDIYFSKFWYSHHGFFHSIGGLFISAISIAFIFHTIQFIAKKRLPAKHSIIKTILIVNVFFFAGFLHLIEDMPTPSGPWGGVRLFWPSKEYLGGWGLTWWWNNYDIFLIVSAVLLINILVISLNPAVTKVSKFIPVFIFCIGMIIGIYQIRSRKYHYNYSGFTANFKELEQKSLEEQQEILKPTTYKFFYTLDKLIPLNF